VSTFNTATVGAYKHEYFAPFFLVESPLAAKRTCTLMNERGVVRLRVCLRGINAIP
jgi:hypothetical protein